jgi:hypothetical protein
MSRTADGFVDGGESGISGLSVEADALSSDGSGVEGSCSFDIMASVV